MGRLPEAVSKGNDMIYNVAVRAAAREVVRRLNHIQESGMEDQSSVRAEIASSVRRELECGCDVAEAFVEQIEYVWNENEDAGMEAALDQFVDEYWAVL